MTGDEEIVAAGMGMRLTLSDFTPQQQMVLECLLLGMGNKDIAADLKLSEWTVKRHLNSIFKKARIDRGVFCPRVRIAWLLLGDPSLLV